MKNDSFVAMLGKLQRPYLGMLEGFWLPLHKFSIQISIVFKSPSFE